MSGPGEPPDRLGRRAFFSQEAQVSGPRPAADGRRALFSSPRPTAGEGRQVVVECRTCLAHTPVAASSVPFLLVGSVWLPGRAWSRLMRCPGCGRTAWCRIQWRALLRP